MNHTGVGNVTVLLVTYKESLLLILPPSDVRLMGTWARDFSAAAPRPCKFLPSEAHLIPSYASFSRRAVKTVLVLAGF